MEGLFTAFNRIADFLVAEKSGELYIGGCAAPSRLSESTREESLEPALSLVD